MSLSSLNLTASQKNVFAASAAIQTYAAAILNQEDIKLNALPDLPKHQQVARQHARKWNEEVLPALVKTNADVIDFANGFAAFYHTLMKLVDGVDAGDKDSVTKFNEGLTLLRNNVSFKEASADFSQTQIQDLKGKLNVDYISFNKDVAAATKILEGNHGELQTITKQIDEINVQLHKMIAVMAGGAVGIVGGVVLVVVGSVATIETQGVASGLILAGVGTLVGGIGSEITGGVEFGLAVEKEKELQIKLADDKKEIGILKHIQSSLDGFVSQLDNAIRSIGVLQQQWKLLSKDLAQVIATLETSPCSLGLKAMLSKAKADWEEALDLARKIQPSGKMPIKSVNNLLDVIHIDQNLQRSS